MNDSTAALYSHLYSIEGYYAPWPVLLIALGAGFNTASIDLEKRPDGLKAFGFSPQLRLSLRSPGFLRKTVHVAGGMDASALLLRSHQQSVTRYFGWEVFPSVGIVVSPASMISIEIGAGGAFAQTAVTDSLRSAAAYDGSNPLRVFCALSLHSASARAFFNAGAGFCPMSITSLNAAAGGVWAAAALGFAVGRDPEFARIGASIEKHFPELDKWREKEKAIAREMDARPRRKSRGAAEAEAD